MRELLADLFGERRTFTGIFNRLGYKNGYNGIEQTVLLTDICDANGEWICDHLWFNYTAGFQALGELQEGTKLQFDARSAEYVKGYKGRDILAQIEHPLELDYKLSYPTKVCIYGQPPPKRQKKEKTIDLCTDRQKEFIAVICETLGIDLVTCETKKEASEWISAHVDEFKLIKQQK